MYATNGIIYLFYSILCYIVMVFLWFPNKIKTHEDSNFVLYTENKGELSPLTWKKVWSRKWMELYFCFK